MIIYNNTEAISLANNTCIYKEGDKANFVYIITEGEVEISKVAISHPHNIENRKRRRWGE